MSMLLQCCSVCMVLKCTVWQWLAVVAVVLQTLPLLPDCSSLCLANGKREAADQLCMTEFLAINFVSLSHHGY